MTSSENCRRSTSVIALCARCNLPFADGEVFVNAESKTWHHDCFRCAQCFCPLLNKTHFLVDGRNYCEYDFKTLYAPSCARCGEFVVGRVIVAANQKWHPDCLRCDRCEKPLDNEGVWHNDGQTFCYNCIKLVRRDGGKRCAKCHAYIQQGKELRYRDEDYHPYHFSCKICGKELDESARCFKDNVYCLPCYDRLCVVCAACRRPIDNERSVYALHKHWHVDHFSCAKCEKPFYGSKFIERRERAYCISCYSKSFADACYKCNAGLTGNSLKVFGKYWCPNCYTCSACDKTLTQKSKIIEMDMRPLCKKCFDRLPKELKQRMLP